MIGSIPEYGVQGRIESPNAASAYEGVGVKAGEDAAKAEEAKKAIMNPGEDTKVKPGRKSSPAECETCKNRKYQDGSDEMVSFKSAAHISPAASGARVRAHEQEHVSNAYKDAAMKGGKVISCSVSLHTAVCPECGRSYVAGGTTSSQIKYSKNPYQKAEKIQQATALAGNNFDAKIGE